MQKIRFYQNKEDLTPAIIFLDNRGTIERIESDPTCTKGYYVLWLSSGKAYLCYGAISVAYLKRQYKHIDSETFHSIDSEIAYRYQDGDISCMREILACIEYREA